MGIGGLMMGPHLTWVTEGVSMDGLNGSQTHIIDGGEDGGMDGCMNASHLTWMAQRVVMDG